MTPELKYKVQRVGTLLAQSPLDDEIKNAIIDNFDKVTEDQLDQILKSLERETVELTSLAKILKEFDSKQDNDWKSLEKEQEETASKIVEDAVK